MAEVILRSINKSYLSHKVIHDFNLVINDGEFVTLLGPSGCGKSTLLRMIAGLEPIDNGELFINGKLYNTIPPQNRGVAMVFQSYALFPHMSVRKNILFGLKIRKVNPVLQFERLDWVLDLLNLRGLEKRLPKEISGGQRQRVALARALVLDPEVLLLDEPLSNLDTALRERALEELKRVHREVGKTIIYVTHNQVEALTMSERIALIREGNLEQYDTPSKLYDTPNSLFAAEFIGSPPINSLEGVIECDECGCYVVAENIQFRVEKRYDAQLRLKKGMPILLAFRPQSISLSLHFPRRYTDTVLEITPEFIENLGDRCLVISKTKSGKTVRFLVNRDDGTDIEKRSIEVVVDGRQLHFFNPQSRLNIV